jgi:hypothetical protein
MFHPDPFAADKPLFAITPQNYKDYAAKLTPGQVAMFAKYATFRMDVYPTRRSRFVLRTVYNAHQGRMHHRQDRRERRRRVEDASPAFRSRFRRTASNRSGITS